MNRRLLKKEEEEEEEMSKVKRRWEKEVSIFRLRTKGREERRG